MNAAVRVLVVDDDESIRQFVQVVLRLEGHTVTTAPHGAAALEVIGTWQPDVILLDLQTPVMDGLEFARRYRETPGPHAPIVLLTGRHDPREAAAQVKAVGFLSKPFDLDELLKLVVRHGGGG